MIKSHFCKAESDHLGVCVCVWGGVCVCVFVYRCVCVCVSENGEKYGSYSHKDYLLWLMAERGGKRKKKTIALKIKRCVYHPFT